MNRSRGWLVGALALALFATALYLQPTPVGPNRPGATPTPTGQVTGHPPATPTAAPRVSVQPFATPTSSPAAGAQGATLALDQMLARLRTAPEQRTGYDRSLFTLWIDADGDGCDTRREVLISESLTPVTIGTGCFLTGGSWLSLYDGQRFTDPSGLDIDHVVPLAEAWDSGAFGWSADRRQAFANDLDASWALIAVSATSNRSKGDQDPADWLPFSASDLCSYLGDWLAVKVRWSLAVDPIERNALSGLVGECSGTVRVVMLAPLIEVGPTPLISPSATCDPAYPTVCIPPPPPDLDCGDIPYRRFVVLAPDPHHFDGDHDLIGCE